MIHRRSIALVVFAFLLTSSCLLRPVQGQSTSATLSGTVQDENNAVVPGAEVVVISSSTGLKREATTNTEGSFTVPLLPPGTYSVTVRRDGFAPVEVKEVILNVADQKALLIQLTVGSITGEVQVTNDAPLINESPAVSTVIDRQFVGNLPLNGRSFQSLILLTPGVVSTIVEDSSPGQFSINGQRNNANYFTVDGVSANVGTSTSPASSSFSQQASGSVPGLSAFGSTNSLVSVDALEEFKIQTSTYSAEFGRQPGGQVQLVTRSGKNEFHGTVFDYIRNEVFDANNWFTNRRPLNAQQIAAGLTKQPRPPLRQNQFGGTFSGPIFLPRFGEGGPGWYDGKNRTFFFFSYEGQRLRLPVVANFNIPSERLRDIAHPALQPILNAYPLPTGPETTRIVNGVPTLSGVAPFLMSYSSPKALDAFSIRLDHAVNGKLVVFGRYNESSSNDTNRSLSFLAGGVFNIRTFTLGATASLTQSLNNELRVNYSSNKGQLNKIGDDFGGAVPVDQSVLLSGFVPPPGVIWATVLFRLPTMSGIEVTAGDLAANLSRQLNIVDNLSWVKGPHQLKFGVDYRRMTPVFGPAAYEISNEFNTEAEVVSGTVSFGLITARREVRPVFNNFSAYGQDTWRPSKRLTLDFGLRWELNPAPYDSNGLRPVLVILRQVSDLPTATLAPSDSPFYKTDYTAFAPRIGVAYLLNQSAGRETVVRGGFGVYYDLGSGTATNGFGLFPFRVRKFVFEVPFPLSTAQATPPTFPAITPEVLPTAGPISTLNPELRLPYTLQWNLAVEQSLGAKQTITLSYVAAAARRLLTTQRVNQRIGDPDFGPRPNPSFPSMAFTTNAPSSDYHSLQAQFQRRLSSGLQVLTNYTWSHAIDEVSNEIDEGTLERGNANFDVRHNFSAAVTYNLPKVRAGKILTPVLRDWSIDAIVFARSGQVLDPVVGGFITPDGTSVNVRPDVVPGQPFWIQDPQVAGGQRLNNAAFALPPTVDTCPPFGCFTPTRQGTLGRNVLRTQGLYQVNAAIGRVFNLRERLNLQLKAEVFNIFNRPHFGRHETNVTSSNAGVPTSMLSTSLGGLNSLYQVGGPRSVQFSLRVNF